MDLHVDQNLESKINQLNNTKQNQEFLKQLKNILDIDHSLVDLPTTENKILKNVLPAISDRFNRVYEDNFSLFETLDDGDELISVLIRENLEVAFELTETVQDILNFIYQHNPINARDIESVIKYIPTFIVLFTDHWKNSSETYKTVFNEEVTQLVEVVKHLYVSFLHILEFLVSIGDNNDELGLLVEVLTSISELSKNVYNLDASSIISSWKCFGTLAAKYSTVLENRMDLRIPITALCEDIYKVLDSLLNNDMEAFPTQIKMTHFLIKLLLKITDIFYQQLDTFALDLVIFYVKILSLPLDHFKTQNFSEEALLMLETDVFKNLDVFLQHLIMGQSNFKNQLQKLSDYVGNRDVFKDHPLGIINLLSKILHMIAIIRSDWCNITVKFIEVIFATLPLCYADLFLDGYNGGISQQLIINMSAAILLQDIKFESAGVLLKYILQDNVFVGVLALEVYTLVVSNIHPEQCMMQFINLLYGVNDLHCGFFTNRSEVVYLKNLLQRIFKILPNRFKDEIIKLFKPDQYIQIWRFLGFNGLPDYQVQSIINPIVINTSECMRSIVDSCSEDMPLNIAEGLDLLSTVDNLEITDTRFSEITNFLGTFWESDFNCNEILDNNIMKYFILRIPGITSSCVQNSILDLQKISSKLKTLSCHKSYWVPIYEIICSILNSIPHINIPEVNRQRILAQIAAITNHPMQNIEIVLLQETYLELFKTLNESQKDVLNFLLDNLSPTVSGQIFQYLEKCSTPMPLIINHHNKNSILKHKCLYWKVSVNTNIIPQAKRAKIEVPLSKPVRNLDPVEKVITNQISSKPVSNKSSQERRGNLDASTFHEAEDHGSAAEVIQQIKSEVKCLLKVCKTEKLTPKNVADLRILMSQISSLM